MNRSATSLGGWSLLLLTLACQGSTTGPGPNPPSCDEATWPDPAQSPYVLPYAAGETYRTGLTNCSSSFHASGNPDQFAFDFDMPEGTPFIAARGGRVHSVVKQAPSEGGGTGNYVVIDHRDGTYGLYYHSPKNGISVSPGDEVQQGDVLGVIGRSGLAGYPHLHFTVVTGDPSYPYQGIPVSFRNAQPADARLEGGKYYLAE